MKVLKLEIEETDGKEVRRVTRILSWKEFEHFSVCHRGQILDQTLYDLHREYMAQKEKQP